MARHRMLPTAPALVVRWASDTPWVIPVFPVGVLIIRIRVLDRNLRDRLEWDMWGHDAPDPLETGKAGTFRMYSGSSGSARHLSGSPD